MRLETVNCNLCDSAEHLPGETLNWKGEALTYAICERCGLKYMRQRPTVEWMAEFYRSEFWQKSRPRQRNIPNAVTQDKEYLWEEADESDTPNEYRPVEQQVRKEAWRANRIWDIVSPHVRLSRNSLVVEFGAGFGQTLRRFNAETGCRCLAVEPSALSRKYIVKNAITLAASTMEEFLTSPPPEKVSLAIMSHILENTNDPLANLRALREILADDGTLFIDTCNFYYNNAINPYHLFIFSQDTLNTLLHAAGFTVTNQACAPHPMEDRPVTDQATAIYVATVASKDESLCEIAPHRHSTIASQKKGLELLHAYYLSIRKDS